jgi:hypothetical protein
MLQLTEFRHAPEVIAISPAGKTLATGGGELIEDVANTGELKLWNIATGRVLCSFERLHSPVVGLAFFPESGTLLGTNVNLHQRNQGNYVSLYESASGQERLRLLDGLPLVLSTVLSNDGRICVIGCNDKKVRMIDLERRVTELAPVRRALQSTDMDSLWVELGSSNAKDAYVAIRTLEASAELASTYLARRLRPVPRPDSQQTNALIRDLDNNRSAGRQRAMLELEKFGEMAEPALRKARSDGSPETRARADVLLGRLRGSLSTEELRYLRSIEVLEMVGTMHSKRLLETLARGAPESRITQRANDALDYLRRK